MLDGLYDPESSLSKLRMPVVKSPLMKMIWDKVTEDWQVISRSTNHILFVIMISSELSGLQWRRFCWRGSLRRPSSNFKEGIIHIIHYLTWFSLLISSLQLGNKKVPLKWSQVSCQTKPQLSRNICIVIQSQWVFGISYDHINGHWVGHQVTGITSWHQAEFFDHLGLNAWTNMGYHINGHEVSHHGTRQSPLIISASMFGKL